MKRYLNKVLISGLIIYGGFTFCEKKLDQTDKNSPTILSYFKTAEELQAGVNSAYSVLRSAALVGREWFFLHDTRGDEMAAGGGQLEAPRAELLNLASPSPANAVMTNVWQSCYIMINRVNNVINSASTVTDNVSMRDQSVGEAKFLRAWAYFELVSQWGEVPLYTANVQNPNDYQGKASEADIYALIVSDLTDAFAKLPSDYNTTPANKGRVTKWAASALLGRVQMQKGDYAAAKTALLQVVNSGKFSLAPNFEDNFLEETEFNQESIFEVVFVKRDGEDNFNWGGYSNGDGSTAPQSTVRNQEYSPIAWRNLIPSNKYLNEFEAGDPRYKKSVYETGDTYMNGTKVLTDAAQNGNSSVVNGVTKKVSWRKYMLIYKDDGGFRPGGINQRLIRYADVLLMLAECEAEVGTLPAALGYINQVRTHPRTGLTPAVGATKNDVLRAIMHERLVELGGEEVRNVDILRWRKKSYYPSVVADPKPGQVSKLPIPQQEIDTNPKVK
jgi:starch-binding outer membrane protein, SusD/RagB family